MNTFSSIVRCATCGKVLSQARGIPATQEDVTAAAEAATRVLACPERGHMRNSNLRFDWIAEPAGSPVIAPPAIVPVPTAEVRTTIAAPPPVPVHASTPADTFDKHGNPLLSDDDLDAAIAVHEAAQVQAAPEVLEMVPLPAEAPAVPVAEGSGLSAASFDLSHEKHDEHEGDANHLAGFETSDLAQSLAANANGQA